MNCVSSNALVCEESGSRPLSMGLIELSAAPVRPKRDRLADHCDVIAAPRIAHDWILDVFRDQVRPFEGARDSALMRDALARVIRCGSGVCLVAVPRGYTDEFAGWLVSLDSLPTSALYVYVRHRWRREHIGTLLLRARSKSGPVGLAYSTDDAVAGQAGGLPVEHSLAAYAALLAFKRKGL